jgi:DNA-3-methyladenine glycosylase I
MMQKRCDWAGSDELYIHYHDLEWGVPEHDDRKLFEMLVLEGAQAGLSWSTVLKKRENYRAAFDNFVVEKIARYDLQKVTRLLADAGIIRNRLKIESAIRNATAFIKVQKEFGTFDQYILNKWKSLKELPPRTKESDMMSKDLKKRGFNFVGSTICYAFMQAVGMVNDHQVNCFRYREIGKIKD